MLKVTRIRAGKYSSKLGDGRHVTLESRKGAHGRYWIARDMHGDLMTAKTLGELRFDLDRLVARKAKPAAKPADDLDGARDEYRAVMRRSGMSAEAFNAAVAALVSADASPAEYLKAAQLVQTPCVCTDGKFYSGGSVVNGVYTGKVGKCYRCNGKAYQTDEDRRRNWGYDQRRSVAV